MLSAPYFTDIAEGPADGQAHWVKTADGLNIRVANWGQGAQTPLKGTILMFPGRTEYIEKYGPAAVDFLQRGYASVAIDWRGQGLADRTTDNPLLGDVVDFTDYQKDVAALMAHVAALKLPKPYFLMAHSMGGCIGLRALTEGLDVKAAAFSAPMWGIQMAAPMRPIAWAISSLSRRLGFDQSLAPGQTTQGYVARVSFAENTLTSDPDMFAFFQRQLEAHPEMELGGPTLRWLNESLREMAHLSTLPAPLLPCVTALGSDEAIVDSNAIRERMGQWGDGVLQLVENGRHEVLMEKPPMRKTVFDAATALFDKHR